MKTQNQLIVHDSMHGEHDYALPDGRDLNQAVSEAARLHPSWERIDIIIRKGVVAHCEEI